MELGLTIPLQRHLKRPQPPYPAETDLALCWDLHVLKPAGRPSLFAVHASSRYAFLLLDPAAAQWVDLPTLFVQGLLDALSAEGLTGAQAEAYLAQAGPPTLTKTHGRRPVAFLNQAVDNFYALPVTLDGAGLAQPQVAHYLNECPCRAAGHEGTATARAFFRRDLARLGIVKP